MNIKKTIIYSLPIVILLILILSNYFLGLNVSNEECGKSNDSTKNINCYLKLALQNEDYLQCFNIGKWTNNIEEECLIKVFTKISQSKKLDSSICEKELTERPIYPSDKYELYEKYPNEKGLYEASQEYKKTVERHWTNGCYYGIAITSKDALICENIIKNDYQKQKCIFMITGKMPEY